MAEQDHNFFVGDNDHGDAVPHTAADPDLLDEYKLDKLRGRNPYPAMSERFRLTEELENARYQNNLLTEKCRELQERIEALQHKVEAVETINGKLTSAFESLRADRDEARSTLCEKIAYNIDISGRTPSEIAEEMGWGYLRWSR